ncbi:hypothetical protein [Gelidibacter salicanalis]|uniref:ThuA domain-containing protein n=1 Tax=Gelidibacter salicanalis TaxID=291193 RepID=A0A934KRC5_9FLAO|nr:hypothetical protein [Gelidibacter salicanalis]MBJ7880670.1 hypothetical protein [Gelidibacter salicanalis]
MRPFTMKYFLVTLCILFMIKANAQDQFRVLLFAQHDDWHYNTIPAAIQAWSWV